MPGWTSAEVSEWCRRALGSPIEHVLFEAGFASRVLGVRLGDGREVVIKVRRPTASPEACVAVQPRLREAGFRCPQPLLGPEPFGACSASVEAYVPGGKPLHPDADAAWLSASALAHQFLFRVDGILLRMASVRHAHR